MRLKHNARYRSGERKSRFSPESVVAVLEELDVTFVPITMRHAACDLEIPLGHQDPFDALLLVQAQEEGLRLLTVDRLLLGLPLSVAIHELE